MYNFIICSRPTNRRLVLQSLSNFINNRPRPINKSSFSFVKMRKKRRLIGRITSWREARQRVKRMKATRPEVMKLKMQVGLLEIQLCDYAFIKCF